MKKTLKKAASSLLLIVLVALAARLGFAWYQVRKMPREVIGSVPFEHETGSIAYALAAGKGFSSPFRGETGPTAWLTPVYPLLVAGIFRVFGIFTAGSFFAVVFLNALFSSAACIPIFHAGKRIGGLGVACGAAWLWALFPNAVMMPFEWVWDTCLAALLGATLLWATLKLADSSHRTRNWCAYGLLWGFTLMTNPSLGSLVPHSSGMGGVPRAANSEAPYVASGIGRGHRDFLLRSLDGAELCGLSPPRSAALEFSSRTLHREQQQLRDAPVRLATQDYQGTGAASLLSHRRDSVHG